MLIRPFVCALQTIAAMAGKVYYCEANKNKGAASSEPRKKKFCFATCAHKFLPWTKCRFNGTFIDESHLARTVGRMFTGFSEMMLASNVRVLATATPLQHTPKVSRTALPISLCSAVIDHYICRT